MIVHLSGTILHREPGRVFVNTGSVGYAVQLDWKTETRMGKVGSPVEVFTCQIVRENDLALYGFGTLLQLEVFELLMHASKVGPKVALGFLNVLNPQEILEAILSGEVKSFGKVPGAGPKTLSQVILDCRLKARRLMEKHQLNPSLTSLAPSLKNLERTSEETLDGALSEGLARLGFTPSEIRSCLKELGQGRGFAKLSTEEQLSSALKWFFQQKG